MLQTTHPALTTIAFVTVLALSSCDVSDDTALSPDTTCDAVGGQWVETANRADTISFESFGDDDRILQLKRGTEVRDGNIRQRFNAGPYEYELTTDTISLRWILSSNSAFNEYTYECRGDELSIGNFFDNELGETLTFERL